MKKVIAGLVSFLFISLFTLVNPANLSFKDKLAGFADATIVDNNSKYVENTGRAVYDLTSPHFQCQNFLNSLNNAKTINIAFLYNTFGNDFDCLKTILQDPRLRTVEFHLINGPCARNHRCSKYEFLSGLTPVRFDNLLRQKSQSLKIKFDKYVEPLQEVIMSYLQPTTECIVNGELEGNSSPAGAKVLTAWAKEAFPICTTAWNPLKFPSSRDQKFVGADYTEGHGDSPPLSGSKCIADNDGTEIPVDNIQEYFEQYGQCKAVYVWTGADNGFDPKNPNAPWVEPRSRPFNPRDRNKVLGAEVVKSQRKLNPYQKPPTSVWTDEEEKSLKGCQATLGSTDGAKRGFLLKQSDAHPGLVVLLPGGKDRKPYEGNVRKLEIFYKGKRIVTFTRTGIFLEDEFKNRPLFRTNDSSKITLSSLPFHVVLREDDGRICRKIENPKVRND